MEGGALGSGGGEWNKKSVQSLLLHCQQCGQKSLAAGVTIRAESSAWLGTQGFPVKNKAPVAMRLLPWPGLALLMDLPKKARARAGQLRQLSPTTSAHMYKTLLHMQIQGRDADTYFPHTCNFCVHYHRQMYLGKVCFFIFVQEAQRYLYWSHHYQQ